MKRGILLLLAALLFAVPALAEASDGPDSGGSGFMSSLSNTWSAFLGMADDVGKAASEWAEGAVNDASQWAEGAMSDASQWAEGAMSDAQAMLDKNLPVAQSWLSGVGDALAGKNLSEPFVLYGPDTQIVKWTGEIDMVDEAAVREKYRKLTLALIEKGLSVTTMESCTSGQIASLITDTEGASAVFKGASITYSNEAKVLQGVPAEIIETYGVYSRETASAMALAARRLYGADIAVGVTGTMGNADPANSDSVPGTVYVSIRRGDAVDEGTLAIAPQESRYAYKLAVADCVADRLLALLEVE